MTLYQQFTEYELSLAHQAHLWEAERPADSIDALHFLERIQRHREQVFGREQAEILWGEELASNEYQLRRNDRYQEKLQLYRKDLERMTRKKNMTC